MSKNKDKKSKKVLSKKEEKDFNKAVDKQIKKNKKNGKLEKKEPFSDDKNKKGKSTFKNKDKKVKSEKKSKPSTKSSKGSKDVLDTTNVFTAVGEALKLRAKPFQLVRHMDEVTVLRNKEAFPYSAERIYNGSFCAVLVKGKEIHAFSRTGAKLQNLGQLLNTFEAKEDGLYISELYVAEPVATCDKFAAMVSPFRKNKLTAPQQKIVDEESMLAVCDYLTIEEFIVGKSEVTHIARVKRLRDLIDLETNARIHFPDSKKVKNQKGLEKFLKKVTKVSIGLTVKGNNPYVCGHQNFHFMTLLPYVTKTLECTGFVEGTGTLKGRVVALEFKYMDKSTLVADVTCSTEEAITMLETCTSKKKKGAPMGFNFTVYALEENNKGVLLLPKVGDFSKDKAEF